MGAQGTATIDFGAFPGKSDTSVAVTGQASITGTSLVEAWLYPTATADHTADEHMLETIKIVAGNVSAGVGFTIYAFNTSEMNEPVAIRQDQMATIGSSARGGPGKSTESTSANIGGGKGTRIYGQWTVAWVWN